MSKKLSSMHSYPTGSQVFSFMKYAMSHWPHSMTELYKAYEMDEQALVSWCTGFAYALALVEDNGVPQDIDQVLHDWSDQDGIIRIAEEIREWMRRQA
jgi:hypothetical protein